jgi:hypothetical protein
VTTVDADIDALKGFHAALVRFRYAQVSVVDRSGAAIEVTRGSLAEKALRRRSALERCQAELDECRSRAASAEAATSAAAGSAGGPAMDDEPVDCSGYLRAVAEAEERLNRVFYWQQQVESEAADFAGRAGAFRYTLENEVWRAEAQLLAMIRSLEAARDV